jgi:hypothetical protein
MHEMAVNIEQAGAIVLCVNDVIFKNLVVERFRHFRRFLSCLTEVIQRR